MLNTMQEIHFDIIVGKGYGHATSFVWSYSDYIIAMKLQAELGWHSKS